MLLVVFWRPGTASQLRCGRTPLRGRSWSARRARWTRRAWRCCSAPAGVRQGHVLRGWKGLRTPPLQEFFLGGLGWAVESNYRTFANIQIITTDFYVMCEISWNTEDFRYIFINIGAKSNEFYLEKLIKNAKKERATLAKHRGTIPKFHRSEWCRSVQNL